MSRARSVIAIASVTLAAACSSSSPTAPSGPSLPFASESATMRYYYEAGDSVEVARQEVFNDWAIRRLGILPPRKLEYRKYLSRDAMGRYTGNSSTNGFAEPAEWRIHTIWPFDNHEVVHVYTAMIGRPSDFFNEGIAVSFQTDPSSGDFTARFNGQQVHSACRQSLAMGMLPLPVSRYVVTSEFRNMPDMVLSYRMAGSFMLYLTERYGLETVLRFFAQGGGRDESLGTIRSRMDSVFGASLDDIERGWLDMLRG